MQALFFIFSSLVAGSVSYASETFASNTQAKTQVEKLATLNASLKNVETIIENVLPLEADKKEEMSPDAVAISQEFNRDECISNVPDAIDQIDVGEDIVFEVPIFEMEISGDKCPMYMKAGARAEHVEEVEGSIDVKGQIYIEYVAKDPRLHEFGGLKKISLVGEFKIKAVGLDESSKKKTFDVSIDFSGEGESTIVGAFKQRQRMSLDLEMKIPDGFFDALFNFGLKMKADEHVLVEFEGFSAELIRETEMKSVLAPPRVVATLNGESITPERFDEISKNMGIPGMDSVGGILDPKPEPVAGMQCLLEVQQPESPFPPFVADNCLGNTHFLNIDGINYQAQFVYMDDVMNVNFGSPDKRVPYHSFFLLPDESFQQTVRYEGFDLTLTCEEAVLCGSH